MGAAAWGDAPDDTGTRGRRYALGWNGAADKQKTPGKQKLTGHFEREDLLDDFHLDLAID